MVIRVCIIGGGPSGMASLGMFKRLQAQGEECEVTVYEKQDAPGGLWNLTWRTGRETQSVFKTNGFCSIQKYLARVHERDS